jgi:hypothetical protein
LKGFCRPFVPLCAGTLLYVEFNTETGVFQAEWEVNTNCSAPTQIYVPLAWFQMNKFIVQMKPELPFSISEQYLIVDHRNTSLQPRTHISIKLAPMSSRF